MILSAGAKKLLRGTATLILLAASQQSFSCGGFFCDVVPIDQAGEQIVFRQEGNETTAMIKIDYVGNAEDFGWVLPVPDAPEISLGSDQIFTELEINTRPQFILERVGEQCQRVGFGFGGGAASPDAASSSSSSTSGVVVEQSLSVGPFDAKVISSDDAQALATWLTDNNLDLTERGDDLLQPYIEAKSKFVVLKLKNFASTGSIQPIILKYQSSAPVIPMTLTAVAAQQDMGVLVWLLGEGRGVPDNYYHVTPNYTRLNWYAGPRSAYASYQTLITQAMDEAGGQGFATDFAGYMPNLPEQFSTSEVWVELLEELAEVSDATFVSRVWTMGSAAAQDAIRLALPTSSAFVYSQPTSLVEVFTEKELSAARASVTTAVEDQVIAPLDNAMDILDDNLYLTRLYTTLSAEEMTVNPAFTFNTAMADQPLVRNATLTAACKNRRTEWTLKLGEGTGREDETVIEAWESIPFQAVATEQEASWRVERTGANTDPVLLASNDFEVFELGEEPSGSSGGAFDLWLLGFLTVLGSLRRRLRLRVQAK